MPDTELSVFSFPPFGLSEMYWALCLSCLPARYPGRTSTRPPHPLHTTPCPYDHPNHPRLARCQISPIMICWTGKLEISKQLSEKLGNEGQQPPPLPPQGPQGQPGFYGWQYDQ